MVHCSGSCSKMCSSRKNPYPPHGRSSEIPRGRGVLKVKTLEAKYEAKLDFLGGWGGGGRECKTKNLPWGGIWIFSGTAQFGKLRGPSRLILLIVDQFDHDF